MDGLKIGRGLSGKISLVDGVAKYVGMGKWAIDPIVPIWDDWMMWKLQKKGSNVMIKGMNTIFVCWQHCFRIDVAKETLEVAW